LQLINNTYANNKLVSTPPLTLPNLTVDVTQRGHKAFRHKALPTEFPSPEATIPPPFAKSATYNHMKEDKGRPFSAAAI